MTDDVFKFFFNTKEERRSSREKILIPEADFFCLFFVKKEKRRIPKIGQTTYWMTRTTLFSSVCFLLLKLLLRVCMYVKTIGTSEGRSSRTM